MTNEIIKIDIDTLRELKVSNNTAYWRALEQQKAINRENWNNVRKTIRHINSKRHAFKNRYKNIYRPYQINNYILIDKETLVTCRLTIDKKGNCMEDIFYSQRWN